ncbi:ion transporter [Microbulbifer sp. CnH-101-G]|uniref:ion transporter n=1 Tax=Microbulbifer sp. CnH-101-G TaxID=3243393 RepID=UPI004039E100
MIEERGRYINAQGNPDAHSEYKFQERGNVIYQLFLLVLSIYVLSVVLVDLIFVENAEIQRVLQYIDITICCIFLLDFFVNLFASKSKLGYLKWGWIDLVASIPALDPLRWGRISKVVRILRFLRTVKSLRLLYAVLKENKLQSITLFVLLISFVSFSLCATLILQFESSNGGSIDTANEALWWAFLNIMNAKVAINQAVSVGGIFLTVLLNKVGLLLFAYLNAILIAWLLNRRTEHKKSPVLADEPF